MQYRYLGNSGLKVSAISYGNWVTHGNQIDDKRAIECVHRARDLGITTFDTADVYAETRAEEVLGKALHGVRRESVELCTKVFMPTGSGENDRGLSRKHVMESCHASLRRLGADHIDLYQAHRYDNETPLEETMVAFADLVHAGKVHYVGVSEWTSAQLRAGHALAQELRIPFVSNQPQYSMLWRVIEAEVVPTCRELGISQIVWSPLLQGVLTGKYQPGAEPPADSRAVAGKESAATIKFFLNDDLLERISLLRPLAEEAGLTMAQLSIAWVLRNDNVASAIVGASRPDQIEDNVVAVDAELDDDLVAAVEEVLAPDVVADPTLTERLAPAGRP
ncbi:MAG TPA: aldo/keto reductase family protein [Microthrixaceae bacterium]|nr:aldo/keto reductase family protein [Microthrixaceae bacterium]